MILSPDRDLRLITIRRGGTLTDDDHRSLAVWSAYAIRAAAAASPSDATAGARECRWQRSQLSSAIRFLVLDDQRRRNAVCWSVVDFDDESS